MDQNEMDLVLIETVGGLVQEQVIQVVQGVDKNVVVGLEVEEQEGVDGNGITDYTNSNSGRKRGG
jgi:hypothetical protein